MPSFSCLRAGGVEKIEKNNKTKFHGLIAFFSGLIVDISLKNSSTQMQPTHTCSPQSHLSFEPSITALPARMRSQIKNCCVHPIKTPMTQKMVGKAPRFAAQCF